MTCPRLASCVHPWVHGVVAIVRMLYPAFVTVAVIFCARGVWDGAVQFRTARFTRAQPSGASVGGLKKRACGVRQRFRRGFVFFYFWWTFGEARVSRGGRTWRTPGASLQRISRVISLVARRGAGVGAGSGLDATARVLARKPREQDFGASLVSKSEMSDRDAREGRHGMFLARVIPGGGRKLAAVKDAAASVIAAFEEGFGACAGETRSQMTRLVFRGRAGIMDQISESRAKTLSLYEPWVVNSGNSPIPKKSRSKIFFPRKF